MTLAPLGWYHTKADIFFVYKISILNQWMTDTTSCIFHTRIDMNHWFFLSWIQTSIFHFSWRTLQVVFFIPTLIWIIDVSFMNRNEGTFLQVLCKWQHIYCQYPWACRPLKAIVPATLYWDILMASLKMPGDHAVISERMSLSKVSLHCEQVCTPGVSQVCASAHFKCAIYT